MLKIIREDFDFWKEISEMAIYHNEDENRKLHFFNYLRDTVKYNKRSLFNRIICSLTGHNFIECTIGGATNKTERLCMKCGSTNG